MAKNKNKSVEPDILEEGNAKLSDVFNNAEYYFEQYKNIILGVVAAIVLVIGGIWGYKNLVKGPKESKVQDAIVYAQKYFEIDSMALALNGDGQHLGFEAIAKQYDGTPAGNRANFGAGVASLKLGKYAEAVKFLDKFSTEDPILEARKYGCLGDAYAEQNQMDKAIENYKKAAEKADNELTAPTYLFRAALALAQKGKNDDALKLFKQVNDNYPATQEGAAAEMYIAKMEAKPL